MGRSNATFNKKEREKKKQQQRKEKEEKREERKASNKKDKSFEDMLAYVDEFGRLSSTPPDPTKKSSINLEDIQIGIAKQKEPDEVELIRKGTIAFFNETKGYGFIKDVQSHESIFFHISSLSERVNEGDQVSFEIADGPKGPTAVKIVNT
jgi:cold shock CspA family protein